MAEVLPQVVAKAKGRRRMRWLRWATLAAGGLVAAYGVGVALIGVPARRVAATAPDAPTAEPALVLSGPAPQALVFVVSAVLLMAGVVRGRWALAWVGSAATAGFALVTGFSIGGLVLPLAVLLLPGVAVLSRAGARGGPAREGST